MMEGHYQPMGQGWLERHTTLSFTLSDMVVWRWEQIAREQNINDNSSLAAFLVKQ